MLSWRLTALRIVLVLVGIIQIIFGLGNLLMPSQFNAAMGYSPIPPWTDFTSRFGGVRFLVMAFGMFLAFRDPRKHITWIQAMIFVQAVDFLIALFTLLSGALPFSQVGGALILPFLWTVLLIVFYPRAEKAA